MIRSDSGEVMVDLEKKSHVYCNLLQFSHYLRFGTRILIFFGAQSFDILIFRFIEYLEHTYWYQNDASKRATRVRTSVRFSTIQLFPDNIV